MAFLLTARQEQRRAISTKLHAVFAENTQRGNVLPSGAMGKYVRQNQHTICPAPVVKQLLPTTSTNMV